MGADSPSARESRLSGVVRPGHAIADPAFVEDPGWSRRILAELSAELLHKGAHQIRAASVSLHQPLADGKPEPRAGEPTLPDFCKKVGIL